VQSDLATLTIAEASSLIAKQEASPVDLVDAVLARTGKFQGLFNSYITLLAEQARESARRLEAELVRGASRGPLHGIPVALKDLFYTKGVRTTAGSKILASFVPDYDSTVAALLTKAGAIIVGKTNTHEFAFGPTTESSYFGPSRNPWDPSRITGGSSGGSAAVVTAGMAFAAMGSDTGGSIRIPACLCGAVGFKPTYGRVSLYGVIPLSYTFDHAGPLARSVNDVALVMDAIAGHDPADTRTIAGGTPHYAQMLAEIERAGDLPLKGMAIGVPVNFFFDKVDLEIERLVRNAIGTLGELGAEIREIELPGLDDVSRLTGTIMSPEATYYHRENLASRPDDYQPDVRARLEGGARISAVDYFAAIKDRDKMNECLASILHDIDVVATPTVPVAAYPIGSTKVMTRGREEPARDMLTRHTRLGNLTGGPALTVPCGLTTEGLPCGLQLMGKPLDDIGVLKAGYAYERKHPWMVWVPEAHRR